MPISESVKSFASLATQQILLVSELKPEFSTCKLSVRNRITTLYHCMPNYTIFALSTPAFLKIAFNIYFLPAAWLRSELQKVAPHVTSKSVVVEKLTGDNTKLEKERVMEQFKEGWDSFGIIVKISRGRILRHFILSNTAALIFYLLIYLFHVAFRSF